MVVNRQQKREKLPQHEQMGPASGINELYTLQKVKYCVLRENINKVYEVAISDQAYII